MCQHESPEMVGFIWWDMQRRVKYGFSILRCIIAVPQSQRQPRLIQNLWAQLDNGTPSANKTTYREIALESMQFGRAFPYILQEIWEADPDKGPVWFWKIDATDAYHHGTLWPSQVGTFTYVIPSSLDYDCITICVYLVLPMG